MRVSIPIILLIAAVVAIADPVPPSRQIPWKDGRTGISIPNRQTISTTVLTGSSTATIQTAINGCPSNQVVLIQDGNYSITSPLTIKLNGVTIRGTSTNTLLTPVGNGTVFQLGPQTGFSAGVTAVTAGTSIGGSNLTVASTTGLVPGMIILLACDNDTNLVVTSASMPRAIGQTTAIMATNATTVTIWPPCQWNYDPTNNPGFLVTGGGLNVNYQIAQSSIENLTCNMASSTGSGIQLCGCYQCWISNVWVVDCGGYCMTANDSLQCSLVHNNFFRQPAHGPNHTGINLSQHCSNCLIENNLFYQIASPATIGDGMAPSCGSGNVMAYNFFVDCYQDGFGQYNGLWPNHNPHNVMTLLEGNYGNGVTSDGYFGSMSHLLIFRNVLHGWTPTFPTANSRVISMKRWSNYVTVLGNILGTNSIQTEYIGYAVNDASPRIYELGYPNSGNNTYTGVAAVPPPNVWHNPGSGQGDAANQLLDLMVSNTIIKELNYDVINAAILTDPSVSDHTLTNSYYLLGKPGWFGTLNWPPYNPTNETADAISMTNIPAGYRYVYGVDPPSGPAISTGAMTAGGFNAQGVNFGK